LAPHTDQGGCASYDHPCLTVDIDEKDDGTRVIHQHSTCNGRGVAFSTRLVRCSYSSGCALKDLVLTKNGLMCLVHVKLVTAAEKKKQEKRKFSSVLRPILSFRPCNFNKI
jgi:hypothetical protein